MQKAGNTIEVCFSPALFGLFDSKDCIVVVADVLRATSSICVAFEHGAGRIVPVETTEESMAYRNKGFIVAAERKGEMVPGFDLGNSPFSFMSRDLKGKTIALTTTNGTRAIRAAAGSYKVAIGSFLNISALCRWMAGEGKNVICLCAGWKNKFNLEDTLFAGAVVSYLTGKAGFYTECDSALAASHLYEKAKPDLYNFLENSSHRKRLQRLHIEKDIAYCLTPDQTSVIPVLEGDFLVNLNS